ncbi:site-specific integrase [Geomonas subterranea]|uniref:Site-specific integrase n=1 Tax=Geomonas subterranea TaxID=2847989 RepID=A0ABX8LKC8_9BACT|nr:site-specific integrase [Geomonas subterranea]QXE92451.1 site-specific integrase [Geomonas subterranea]QXM09450.1 site-specific integrase [Geomonas subterranea]
MKKKITLDFLKTLAPQEKLFRVYDTSIKGFVLRIQPTGTMTFYYEYRNAAGVNKSYKIGRLGDIKLAQARERAEEKSAEALLGIDVQAKKKSEKQQAKSNLYNTLSGFLDKKYEPWAMAELRTGKDVLDRIRRNFSHLLDRELQEIHAWDISKWRAEQMKKGKKPSTVNRDISCLYSALSRAVEWGVISIHPLEKLKPIKTDSNGAIRYLSEDERTRLITALNEREAGLRAKRLTANKWRLERKLAPYPEIRTDDFADYLKPMVLVTLNTGLRRGELFSLRWEDVNFDVDSLTVHGVVAKNKTTRHIPLNETAKTTLKRWKEQTGKTTGFVFGNKKGERFDNIYSSWDSLVKYAAINNFRWHDMRHDFASKLVMAGVPLNTVRELLGHSDIRMTLRYAHLAQDHKADAVRKLASL